MCYTDTSPLSTSLPTYQRIPCYGTGRYLFISQNTTGKLGFNELEVLPIATCSGCSAQEICQRCPENHYCPNSSLKIPCPPNSKRAEGSLQFDSCQALPGYYLKSDSEAVMCPENHYCLEGSTMPIPCPLRGNSSQGSTSPNNCNINIQPGYFLSED